MPWRWLLCGVPAGRSSSIIAQLWWGARDLQGLQVNGQQGGFVGADLQAGDGTGIFAPYPQDQPAGAPAAQPQYFGGIHDPAPGTGL